MNKVIYNSESIIEAKKKIDMYNGNIYNALTKINDELSNMESVINTPKMKKSLPVLSNYYNRRKIYIGNMRDSYNRIFNTIIGEYQNYVSDVNKVVGGNND